MERSAPSWPRIGSRTLAVARLGTVLAGFVFGISTELPAARQGDVVGVAADFAVGAVFLVGGLLLWLRRQREWSGPLMIAAGFAWFAGGVLHRGPVSQLLLGYPSGRLKGRWTTVVVAIAYLDGIVETVAPFAGLSVVWAVALALMAFGRVATSTGPVRRARLGPALGATLQALVVVVGAVATASSPNLDVAAQVAGERLAAQEAVLGLIAVVLAGDAMIGAWSQAAVTGLVVDLGDSASGGTLRDRLATALGDPSLDVAFPLPDGSYVDEAGRPVEVPDGDAPRRTAEIVEGAQLIAVLVHDAAVLDDPELVASVATAARISLTNARLQADIRSRIAEIDASRRRIVEAANRQRQRIERELEAGPLARLERVRSVLGAIEPVAAATAGPDAPFTAALAEVVAAIEEVKDFARGVYPAVLVEQGLAQAVTDLARRGALPVSISVSPGRLPAQIEATAYFIAAEALANAAKHSHATRVRIELAHDHGRVHLVVVDDGIGGADSTGSGLSGLADRVAAIGGRLTVDSPRGRGTRVEADIPVE